MLNGGDCFGCCFHSRSPRFTELACVETRSSRVGLRIFSTIFFSEEKDVPRRGMSGKEGLWEPSHRKAVWENTAVL